MDALDLLQRGFRRVAPLQQAVDAMSNQVILDRGQPLRAFRMEMPHLVEQKLGVRVVAGRHGLVAAVFA
jgi:flagella basal body P-ring formation protein FlgA